MSLIRKPKEGLKELGFATAGMALGYVAVQTLDPAVLETFLSFIKWIVATFITGRAGFKGVEVMAVAMESKAREQANAVIEANKLPKP